MGGAEMSGEIEYQTDLDVVLKDRIKKLEDMELALR